MKRLIAVGAAPVMLLGAWVGARAQSKLAFEVVSIKPVAGLTADQILAGTPRIGINIDAGRVQIIGFPLFSILMQAFRVQTPQLQAPDFTHNQYFDIQATFPEGATKEQMPEMLQTMLAERFKLAYHRETRQYEVTVLTVGKNGMKLPRLPEGTQPAFSQKKLDDGTIQMTQTGTVTSLFAVMNSFGGLQMVDETGLDGMYTWVHELPAAATPGVRFQDVMQESFRVMIEAAGLKMETRKTPKDTIIVDHLEKQPTDN